MTAVAVSKRCADLARKVTAPGYRVGDNPKLTVKQFEAALEEANGNLGATRACILKLSADYAAGLRR